MLNRRTAKRNVRKYEFIYFSKLCSTNKREGLEKAGGVENFSKIKKGGQLFGTPEYGTV